MLLRLESERLLLRPFVADDFDALFAMQSRSEVARWLYWEPRTEEQVRAALEQRIDATSLRRDGDGLGFAVVLKETSEVIGDASLMLRSAEHRQGETENEFVKGAWQSELGYAILEHEWAAAR